MKRTYKMTHPKIKTARLFEGVKGDIRKYMKRERRKELPKGVDYWDFNCKFGATEEEANEVHVAELNRYLDAAEADEVASVYVEVIAAPGVREKRPRVEGEEIRGTSAPAELGEEIPGTSVPAELGEESAGEVEEAQMDTEGKD
jgi:hypothetical protein